MTVSYTISRCKNNSLKNQWSVSDTLHNVVLSDMFMVYLKIYTEFKLRKLILVP